MQVSRRRRPITPARNPRTVTRTVVAGAAVVALAGGGLAYGSTTGFGTRQVGQEYADGLQISSNQVIKPHGRHVVTEYGKFVGSTISPDGRFLAASSMDRSVAVQVFDLAAKKLVFRAGTAAGVDLKLNDNSVGQEGPTFSPDGKFLWLSQANGVTRFPVNVDGALGAPTKITLKTLGNKQPLPGKVVYSPDRHTVYVAVNGQNTVVALDPTSGKVLQTWTVGIAPRDLTFVGDKLYVSNEGGRLPKAGDDTMNTYGTEAVADEYLGTSTNGSVSVIDTATASSKVATIKVGLHPTALHVAGHALYVANTNSDTVSVVDTRSDKVVQTISTQSYVGSKVGYHPSGIATTPDGRLLVTLARANAVAVFRTAADPKEPVSLVGLVPTDYYPHDIAVTGGHVVVTNNRGIDARGPSITFNKGKEVPTVTGHGTHSTTASLTDFALPGDQDVKKMTATVFAQNGWTDHDVQKGDRYRRAVAVPTRVGDPSTIKHVFLLVKENRTYDQLFGDDPRGNGDPALAQFGRQVTPNLHALNQQFSLFDNVYDTGTNSAEGHSWLMQGDNPEYTESSGGEYIRSYDTEDDVLGHQRSGFLWTSVMSKGASARNFGEFMQFETKPSGATWQKYYCAAKAVEGGAPASTLYDPAILSDTHSPIPSLEEISIAAYPKFDNDIPDIYRYQVWKDDFQKNGPAQLNMLWLSSDHTGGAANARAMVADGDVATGKIIDTISHSPYWKDSAIFVVEDDSQNGADHVDGHRAPVHVVSPYAKRGGVISTYYSQINMIRTIQQIFGAQPLNQKLAAATPMFDAFTNKPDLTPFTAVPNQVPLTEGVATLPACGADVPGGTPAKTTTAINASTVVVPAAQKATAAAWATWKSQQLFATGRQDSAAPELMNRYTWYSASNWSKPFPGDKKIYKPAEVPGGYIPARDND